MEIPYLAPWVGIFIPDPLPGGLRSGKEIPTLRVRLVSPYPPSTHI